MRFPNTSNHRVYTEIKRRTDSKTEVAVRDERRFLSQGPASERPYGNEKAHGYRRGYGKSKVAVPGAALLGTHLRVNTDALKLVCQVEPRRQNPEFKPFARLDAWTKRAMTN
jgi:hypothetical protein